MRHILAVALSALLVAPAFGQSVGTLALTGPSTTPGAPQLTPAAINAAVNAILSAKQDYNAPGLFTTLNATGTTTLSGLLHLSQPASIQFDGTRTWSGSQSAIGSAEIYSFTNQTGATSSGNPVAFHFLSVASDTVQNAAGAGVANLRVDTITGAGILGGRNNIWSNLTIGGTPGDIGQYVAGTFAAQASAPANAGSNILYGTNPTCGINGTATGNWQCVGEEIDIAARTGSAPTMLTGLTIVTVSGHTAHGSLNLDSAISIGNQSGTTTGWDYGLRFGGPSNLFPFVSTATLIYAYPATGGLTIANGLDMHNLTFTGNAYSDGHIVLTGAGTANLNAGSGLSLSATAGFVQLPFTAGIPTGAPSGNTNCAIDTTNGYLNCYYGAAWHKIAFAAGAG